MGWSLLFVAYLAHIYYMFNYEPNIALSISGSGTPSGSYYYSPFTNEQEQKSSERLLSFPSYTMVYVGISDQSHVAVPELISFN